MPRFVRGPHKRSRLPRITSEIAPAVDKMFQEIGRYLWDIHVLSGMNKTIACTIDRARTEASYEPKVGLRERMLRSIRWTLDNGQAL